MCDLKLSDEWFLLALDFKRPYVRTKSFELKIPHCNRQNYWSGCSCLDHPFRLCQLFSSG